jgi:hypothetical protein
MMLIFLLVLAPLLMVCAHVSIPILGPSDIYVIAYMVHTFNLHQLFCHLGISI